MAMSKYEVTGE